VSQDHDNPTSTAVVPPFGLLQASVDSKGRLKFPERMLAYLKGKGIEKVFVTTFDLKQARIYPINLRADNEKVFRSAGQHAEAARRFAHLANYYGGEDEVDGVGRLLIPGRLRELIGLDEKAPVWLSVYNGYINVVTRAAHEQIMASATVNVDADRSALEGIGLL
jgi:DNA-binding transcriptional regulator/RsmH inhibitor MraZ